MFSHKILPTVSLSSRMALSLGLAVLGTGSLLFLFPSPALPDFPSLPALAEAEGRTSEPEIRKPGRLPRRDPFRPLDHPSLPASSKPPVVPAKAQLNYTLRENKINSTIMLCFSTILPFNFYCSFYLHSARGVCRTRTVRAPQTGECER